MFLRTWMIHFLKFAGFEIPIKEIIRIEDSRWPFFFEFDDVTELSWRNWFQLQLYELPCNDIFDFRETAKNNKDEIIKICGEIYGEYAWHFMIEKMVPIYIQTYSPSLVESILKQEKLLTKKNYFESDIYRLSFFKENKYFLFFSMLLSKDDLKKSLGEILNKVPQCFMTMVLSLHNMEKGWITTLNSFQNSVLERCTHFLIYLITNKEFPGNIFYKHSTLASGANVNLEDLLYTLLIEPTLSKNADQSDLLGLHFVGLDDFESDIEKDECTLKQELANKIYQVPRYILFSEFLKKKGESLHKILIGKKTYHTSMGILTIKGSGTCHLYNLVIIEYKNTCDQELICYNGSKYITIQKSDFDCETYFSMLMYEAVDDEN